MKEKTMTTTKDKPLDIIDTVKLTVTGYGVGGDDKGQTIILMETLDHGTFAFGVNQHGIDKLRRAVAAAETRLNRGKDQSDNDEMIVTLTAALADAVRAKDRDRIRQIGEDLNGLGGFDLMKRVLDEVAGTYDDPEYAQVCNMVDHAWNGVGVWIA
jgi:hypothetical protein